MTELEKFTEVGKEYKILESAFLDVQDTLINYTDSGVVSVEEIAKLDKELLEKQDAADKMILKVAKHFQFQTDHVEYLFGVMNIDTQLYEENFHDAIELRV